MSLEIINPEPLGRPSGWNNGMLAPAGSRILFVAGQAGSDASGKLTTKDFVGQWAQSLDNILTVVRAAGGNPEDIARMTVYVIDREAYLTNLEPLGKMWRERMGKHYPAMALLEVKGLVDPDALVEIEATAVIPEQPHHPA